MNGWACRFLLTAGVPHTRFARGPTPVTVLVEEASYMVAAPGHGLSAVPAAREAFVTGCARFAHFAESRLAEHEPRRQPESVIGNAKHK